jgi:hypothetical protein
VCDRDASDTVVIARWRDGDFCTDCLAHWYAMEAEEESETMTTTITPQPAGLCDVCDREESASRVLTRWEGTAMCADCLAAMDAQIAAGACVCLACLRHVYQKEEY